jgi:hypothetical protein
MNFVKECRTALAGMCLGLVLLAGSAFGRLDEAPKCNEDHACTYYDGQTPKSGQCATATTLGCVCAMDGHVQEQAACKLPEDEED